MKRPLLFGHRGVRATGLQRLCANLPAENTLAAFEHALAQGCDGFEFDVRHTRDGRNLIWHDPECHGLDIANSDMSQLRARHGTPVACLKDVLRQFGSRAYLDIELKVEGGEQLVLAALRADAPQRGFMVSSFLPEVLQRMSTLAPDLSLGYICDKIDHLALWSDLPAQVVLPHYTLVQPALIHKAHQHGLQIMAWTVNDPARMRELAEWGVDGLISDDPTLLYQTFHSD